MTKKAHDSNLLLGDAAYEAVRQAIVANELQPGDRVSEYKVAEWLGISRTPAREGLRRLENEGLLTQHPRRGLVVSSIDEDAVPELYALRELLEGGAAAMAARHATENEIETLRMLLDAEKGMADDPEEMYAHNRAFHERLYRASHNRFLLKFLLLTADTLSAYRTVTSLVFKERRDEVLREHQELVDAIANRDEAAAQEIAVRHVQHALRARMRVRRSDIVEKTQTQRELLSKRPKFPS